MSKPVKELIKNELVKRLDGVTSVAVVGLTGIDAITTNQIRSRLLKKDIRIMVVKNSIAKRAFESVGLEKASSLLDGPCALAYGSDSIVSVVRELLDIKKDAPNLTVKAALLEGDTFQSDRIDELSKYPTRDEAIARLVGCILSAGGNIAACLIGPSGKLASILKTIEEKQGGGDSSPEGESAPEAAA